jgi:hypothetical protein
MTAIWARTLLTLVNIDHCIRGLVLVAGMNRNIFYIIGVIVVIVIVLKLLGLF